ncbi:MAG: hypothetical protein HY848_21190 [Betaproteobacteria bacterium]|nr:hypothetical protein [Betaproteobacteria bacterium]
MMVPLPGPAWLRRQYPIFPLKRFEAKVEKGRLLAYWERKATAPIGVDTPA